MQTLEAIISLFFLLLIANLFIFTEEQKLDTNLYRYHLSNDIWRVLYLKGDFKDFDFSTENKNHKIAENDLSEIYDMTNLCTFISGERLSANQCRGKVVKQTLTTEKTLIVGGLPRTVTLTLEIKDNH